MKSQTSQVARSCRIREWASMVQECRNRPNGMSVDEWCQAITSQQFRWLMEGLTITPKKTVQEVAPPTHMA